MIRRSSVWATALCLLIGGALACQLPGSSTVASPSPWPALTPTARPIPDLSRTPLYWFAPLPPMSTGPGRNYIGSDDFMGLFAPGAPWDEAASHIQVFKLYGEWVGSDASAAELRQVVSALQQRGIALGIEEGPLTPGDCGQGVEGFAGSKEGRVLADRIQAAGGTIDVIGMDEPYFYGHFYDGRNACHWSAEMVAQQVDGFIKYMRSTFPKLVVGDTEPLAGDANAAAYETWLTTFRSVSGYDLAFLHMDVDWSRSTWPTEVKTLEDFGRARGIPIGMIYAGDGLETTDQAWLTIAGERVKRYELEAGGRPDHVLFQSWDDKPDHTLPETTPDTFTWFINAYFGDKSALGIQTHGQGANLAFKKPVRVSRALADSPGEQAVDGDAGTIWGSGSGPTQWIEVDLGQPHNIQEIRLTISQYPAGRTVHRLLGQGPATGGAWQTLYTFDGLTDDSQILTFKPDQPLQEIQAIRVETVVSPSWVSWREIEVIDAGP